jgi:spermidine synthase
MTQIPDSAVLPDAPAPTVADVATRVAATPDRFVPPAPRRPHLDLFLISFLILFFELAAIRWFGSTVVFLTFFTNIVLLATFLGMSVGLLTAGRRTQFIRWTLPLTFLSVGIAMIAFHLYLNYFDKIAISVGNQTASPQLIYFGTEYRPKDVTKLKVIPLWAVAGAFFTLIAVTFVGLGQAMGQAFDAIPNRVKAYTTDVLGSLTGIAAFACMSYNKLSPQFWFAPIVLLLLYLVRRWTPMQMVSAIGIVFLIGINAYGAGQGQIFWSPYYKIAYTPQNGNINTNNIAHQQMHKIEETGSAYSLVHLLNRDAGGKPFQDVMIIGAGSGNDVAAALRYGTKDTRIDAVEIDPVINQIGRWDHPDQPYSDPRVSNLAKGPKEWGIHLDDGRSFTRKTPHKYDLAIYALVDSLVLHSGYSSIRLENFLFTKQAFRDIKATLKPGGVFAMYNYYRQGWVVGRLKQMAKEVFGTEPIVLSLPYQNTISPSENQKDHINFLIVGENSEAVERIRKQFEEKKYFWANFQPKENDIPNGFTADATTLPGDVNQWRKIGPANVVTTQPASTAGLTPDEKAAYNALTLLPEDNWPQLYLRDKRIPWEPTAVGMITIAVMSVLILLVFAGPVMFRRDADGKRALPNLQMFFLGAGFMLLETKGVVHMALLFGSTWIVNSVVFFAILVMILCANLFVMAMKPRNLLPYYALLVVALLVNALVPMDWFLSLDVTARTIASCAVVFVPVFFAGVIFATSFRESTRPDVDFGSNVAGIILGGLSEQLSLMIGFNYLLLVATGYYLLSMIFKPRMRAIEPAEEPVAVTDASLVPAAG